MTTSPVMTVTDELLAELEELSGKATQGRWCTDAHAWVCAADSDQLNNGFVISICEGPDDLKNADYIAKAGPQTITALTAELRRLRAENAGLAQSLAESRANDQAAMGWLTSLRWASGDRGERMLPELVTHIEGFAKDAGRYRAIRNSLGSQQSCWHTEMPCISDPISPFVTYTPDGLDAAIDTAMQADK